MTTRRTLFAAALLLMGAALLTSCQKEADSVKKDATAKVPEGSLWLSLEASKVADTKALALDGSALNAYWKAGEGVKVLLDGACIGTLTATPNATDNSKATLSGTVSDASGLAENAVLTLLFPRETWDYSGQAGTLASIEAGYDYAAAEVEVVSRDGENLTTTQASFDNQQSICKFTFTGLIEGISSVTIHSAGGKLVASSPVGGSPTNGDITVTLDDAARAANGEGVVYAALRFNALEAGQTEELTITVTDTGSNNYVFTKTSPSGGFINGRYYTTTLRRIVLDEVTDTDGNGELYVAAQDGDIFTGDFMYEGYITIAKGAAVTLDNANFDAPSSCDHAAIHCLGSAHIILNGDNFAYSGNSSYYPAVLAAHNDTGIGDEYTLTISGTGTLLADSEFGYRCAGIGSGSGSGIPGGNIVIAGGVIEATGAGYAAGIGSAFNSSCGSITISGGQVSATGGQYAAGIGSGYALGGSSSCGDILISAGSIGEQYNEQYGASGGQYAAGIGSGHAAISSSSECGTITITDGIDYLYASKNGKARSTLVCIIGNGQNGSCGTVTIAGSVMDDDQKKYGVDGSIGKLFSYCAGRNSKEEYYWILSSTSLD